MWYLLLLGALLLDVQPGACQGSSNEGQRFAFALPPSVEDVISELIITAREDTTVVIQLPFFITRVVDVTGGTAAHFTIDTAVPRCITDVEDKGITITASNPITAHLVNMENTSVRNPDATLLRPLRQDDTDDQYVISYLPGSSSGSPEYRPKSFLLVVAAANEGETDCEVWHFTDGEYVQTHEFTLGRNQVFTEDDYQVGGGQGHDYTAASVRCSRAVALYAGHGCALLPTTVSNTNSRYIFDSMPRTHELGTSFSTIPYHFGWQGGYVVRIMSVTDGTILSVPAVGIEEVKNQGEWVQADIPANRQGMYITCSQPCIAAQFANQADAGGSPGGRHINPHMLVLVHTEHYSADLLFATPSFADDTEMGLSINVNFFPVDDLYLDDMNLDNLEWQPTVGSTELYHTTLSIDPGQHTLYTMDPDNRFTAYLYGSHSAETLTGSSWGFNVGYGEYPEEDNSTSIYW